MAEHWPKILVIVLLGGVVGIPFLLQPDRGHSGSDVRTTTLIIMAPHNEQIRFEFAGAFNAWRADRGEPLVAEAICANRFWPILNLRFHVGEKWMGLASIFFWWWGVRP